MIQGALFDDLPGDGDPDTGTDTNPPAADESGVIDQDVLDPDIIRDTSAPFVGAWLGLVSQTNWEKGRIVHQWRAALMKAGAPVHEYADEAWGCHVQGTVSGQHVGRLRRVFQKFGDVQDEYGDLSWTHFQAALDWSDAEMWLEGAVQENWSVSVMCENRWEALGAPASEKPQAGDIIYAELDEDSLATLESKSTYAPGDNTIRGSYDKAADRQHFEGPDFGDHDIYGRVNPENIDVAAHAIETSEETSGLVQPFKDLPDLPADLQEPLDNLKVALLRHKARLWDEVSAETVVGHLNGLIQMLVTPAQQPSDPDPTADPSSPAKGLSADSPGAALDF